MKAVSVQGTKAENASNASSSTLGNVALRLVGLMIFDAMSLFFIYLLLSDGYWQIGIMIGIVALLMNFIFLRESAYPLRWMSPGLAFMILISIYPIIFTIYIAFTNFGTGNLLPKVQAIEVLEQRQFLPETGITYDFALFRNSDSGDYAIWLQPEEGDGFLAVTEQDETAVLPEVGALNEEGVPANIDGYSPVSRAQLLRAISDLDGVNFGVAPNVVRITGLNSAAELEQRYVYDETQNSILDRQSDILYIGDEQNGTFTSADGDELIPGYQVTVGLTNFERFISNPSFRGPLLRIFLWTTAFAALSVFLAFSLGLLIAIAFGRKMPFQKFIKSALIIPFAVPNVITVLIWKGLLNPLNGVYSTTLADVFNQPVGWPPVFSDPFWVKVALIVINLWLAYPYFMLINSGALQAIPQDMYEAADIDGANAWQKFRGLTLPMLLVGVGPLLLASFTTNFNSFNVIFLFNSGGPPMVGTSTPAGHSDILISYVYRLAFAGAGQDFGYASAITIIIFMILVVVTLFQFRFMRVWEEVGESV